jgi:hypothetical protein
MLGSIASGIGSIASGNSAPNLAYFSREYADSGSACLSGSQQNDENFLS